MIFSLDVYLVERQSWRYLHHLSVQRGKSSLLLLLLLVGRPREAIGSGRSPALRLFVEGQTLGRSLNPVCVHQSLPAMNARFR